MDVVPDIFQPQLLMSDLNADRSLWFLTLLLIARA